MLKAKPKADDPAAMQGNMEFAFALLERQQAKTHELNEALAGVQDSITAKNKLVSVTRSRLQVLGAARRNTQTKTSHDVTVVVQANRPGAVELKLVYMVSNASWSPAYGELREHGGVVSRDGRFLTATPAAPVQTRVSRARTQRWHCRTTV